jgi:hypothetical protein
MSISNPLKMLVDYSAARTRAVVSVMTSHYPPDISAALDVLRGGAWFEALRISTHQQSAYGVGKQIQPQTYRPREGGRWPQHHNLWAKYAQGVHLPGSKTRADAHQVDSEAENLLTAAAWVALDVGTPLGSQGDALLRRLRLGVQQAVFEPRGLEAGRYRRRTAPVLPLRLLANQADLDGVAAMVILLREAHEAGNSARAFDIGRALYGALLAAGTNLPLSLLASELLEFFIQAIFPLANHEGMALDIDRDEFHEQRRLLHRCLLQLEDAGRVEPEDKTTRALHDILSGRFGFDLYFGLGPQWRLLQSPELASEKSRSFVASMRVGREWGLGVLRRGQQVRLVPEEVAAQMAAAQS